jgi:hypothetical protein
MAIPVPRNLRKHQVTVPNAGEWVDWVLWDTQTYVDNTTLALDFFTTTNAAIQTSNMETAGQLPGQKMFLLRAIGVSIGPATVNTAGVTPFVDAAGLINNGALRLDIGSKSYAEWPIYLLSAGVGVYGQSYTGAATNAVNSNGIPDPRATYALARPLLLTSNLNFKCRCEWAVAVNTTANCRVRVMLKGELGRPVQ